MKVTFFKISFVVVALFYVFACTKENETELMAMTENNFKFMPDRPKASDEISIITYDCGYNELSEVNREGFNIEVIKNFNGMMKWPCVLTYDTIPLGKLQSGTYQVKFIIMDTATNILASDRIFHSEIQELVVK